MKRLENQIPRFDIIRKDIQSRYYVVDRTLSGVFRFGYGISNDEAVFRDGTSVKCAEDAMSGDNRLKVDNEIIGIVRNCYVKVGEQFYLVNYVDGSYIYFFNTINKPISVGEEVRLFSYPIEVSTEGQCSEIEFEVGTTLSNGSFSYIIQEDDTVESIAELLSTMGLVKTFGTTIYVTGAWSSSLSSCVVYDGYPVDSGFLKLQSLVFIVEGDDLVLFNEDVRANNTVTITKVSEQYSVSGYTYIVSVEGLSGVFKYGQLRAFPAYKSKKLNIHSLKPSFVDICGDTVYGKDVTIVKGVRTYSGDTELTRGFTDLKYIANLPTEPSDLWLCEVLAGKIEPVLPNLNFIMDDDGFFRMYIDSKIDAKFVLRLVSSYADLKVSITDKDGNILASGGAGDYIEAPLNKVTFNIKGLEKLQVKLDTFKHLEQWCTHIDYYFVCREMSNERVEVNGLHLNPIFKNYRELLAVIGRDRAGEGRVTL